MPVAAPLRTLDIDLPAQPQSLVQLSLLMAEEDTNLHAISRLIEADMALASAVLKAVNSSLYGMKSRVQSVHQAIGYLGMREVAGITYEIGLRSAFPPRPELEPIWQRAGKRGLLMGRLAQSLGLDAWAAHSAGLFEECGKAVLLRHAPEHYPTMLRAAADDTELVLLEHTGFGVSHDALGAAMCESWGLGPAVLASVRHHVQAQAGAPLPGPPRQHAVLAVSVVVAALMNAPERLDDTIVAIAPQAELDETAVLRMARRLQEQFAHALTRGA